MTTQIKEQVINRFNREALVWNDVHSGEAVDIIQWEVKKRKQFARDFIAQKFSKRPATILEVGCGAGRNLSEIVSENPLWKGVGVDNAQAMVQHCQNAYAHNPQLAFQTIDIESTVLDQTFDVILLLGVVGYFQSNAAALRNVHRMLRPGGYVIFTFGKGLGLARGFRAGTRAAIDCGRRLYHFMLRKPYAVPERSLFCSYTSSSLKRAFPQEWRIVECMNLVFGSGMLKRTSVRISRFLEPLFGRHDPFRLALTSIIVVVNQPKNGV
jgi:SAM-dependent methyltransferase